MGYDQHVARISRMANAWEVSVYEKKEAKPIKNGMVVPYEDPWKSYAFPNAAAVMKFLGERLDKLKSGNADDEFADGFKEATTKPKK